MTRRRHAVQRFGGAGAGDPDHGDTGTALAAREGKDGRRNRHIVPFVGHRHCRPLEQQGLARSNHFMRKSAPFRFGSIAARTPLALPGQRIGLVGGSFNPPHMAHRIISQVALKRLGLDRVWWIVTPGNPLKSRTDLLPLGERVTLARAMAADGRIVVTDVEKHLASSFTAGTLAHLVMRHPETRFVWVMGADCLAGFHRWKQWRDIFRTMPIAVVDRPGWRLPGLASPAARAFASRRIPEGAAMCLADVEPPCWAMLTSPLMAISSTEIRTRAHAAVAAHANLRAEPLSMNP
jgi:nicotinate-nucleotide adenylyltransferase